MAADGRNPFNRLVINSRDWNYQIVHVTIGDLSDFSKSAIVDQESKLEHRSLLATTNVCYIKVVLFYPLKLSLFKLLSVSNYS